METAEFLETVELAECPVPPNALPAEQINQTAIRMAVNLLEFEPSELYQGISSAELCICGCYKCQATVLWRNSYVTVTKMKGRQLRCTRKLMVTNFFGR